MHTTTLTSDHQYENSKESVCQKGRRKKDKRREERKGRREKF
jgi:hypothetical protein